MLNSQFVQFFLLHQLPPLHPFFRNLRIRKLTIDTPPKLSLVPTSSLQSATMPPKAKRPAGSSAVSLNDASNEKEKSPKRRRTSIGLSAPPAPSTSYPRGQIGFGPDPPEHGVWEILSEHLHGIPMYKWVNITAAKLFKLVKVTLLEYILMLLGRARL